METHAIQPPSLLGRNTTVFNAIVQYANIDTLRALAVVSRSSYLALQRCQFDRLTMVVLESPIKPTTHHLAYNDDPPHCVSDQPEFTVDDETLRSVDSNTLVLNEATYLHIPDYARQLMARTRHVTLVVYRRFLGRSLTPAYSRLANILKYGEKCGENGNHPDTISPLHHAMCGSNSNHQQCPNSEASSSSTHTSLCRLCYDQMNHLIERYNLGFDLNVQYGRSCKDPATGLLRADFDLAGYDLLEKQLVHMSFLSHAYLLGDDYGHWLRLAPTLGHDDDDDARWYRFFDGSHTVPSRTLTLKPNNKSVAISPNDDTNKPQPIKKKRKQQCVMPIDIDASYKRTFDLPLQFRNLPNHNNQPIITTSLDIRMLDYDHFGCAHWGDAIPGCYIQPQNTWTIDSRDDVPDNVIETRQQSLLTHIGDHFPHLQQLRLHRQQVARELRRRPERTFKRYIKPLGIHDFLINSNIDLPQLNHFGVIGCLIPPEEFATVAIANDHIQTLEIDPGVAVHNNAGTDSLKWISALCAALDAIESQAQVTETDPALRISRKFDFILAFGNVPTERWCNTPCVMKPSSPPRYIPSNSHFDEHRNYISDDDGYRMVVREQCEEHGETCAALVSGIHYMLRAAQDVEQEVLQYSIGVPGDYPEAEPVVKPSLGSGEDQWPALSRRLWWAGDDPNHRTIVLNLPKIGDMYTVGNRSIYDGTPYTVALLAIARLAQRCLSRLSVQCGYCSYYHGLPMFPTPQQWSSVASPKDFIEDTVRCAPKTKPSLPYGAPYLANGFRRALAFDPRIQVEFPSAYHGHV